MSGYPYGREPPQYPNPNAPIYPQIYNPVNTAVPGQPGFPAPGQPGFPMPGQNAYGYQPGFPYSYQPGQPGQAAMPPTAMSYPGMPATTATGPSAPSYGYTGFPNVTPTSVYGDIVQWVPTTPNEAISLSDRAVVGGYEGYDNSPLWVIRASFQGDMIPGKLAAKHKAAYVAWGGNENAVHNIEVCCARPDRIKWIESRDGNVPPNAVIGGRTASGEPLYVGRAREQGSMTPGKIHQSHKAMYISFAGKEVPHKSYEVLCTV